MKFIEVVKSNNPNKKRLINLQNVHFIDLKNETVIIYFTEDEYIEIIYPNIESAQSFYNDLLTHFKNNAFLHFSIQA